MAVANSDIEIMILEPEDYIVVDTAPEILDLSFLGSKDYAEFEAKVIRLTNEVRMNRGLHPLTRNDQLSQAALTHALDMAENRFINHTGSDGSQVSHRVTRADYKNWIAVGENLALGQRTPEEAMRGWMNSPGHRKNLLQEKFREIGVAYIEGDILAPNGTPWRGGYWVQNFGTRLSLASMAPAASRLWRDLTGSPSEPKIDKIEITILDDDRNSRSW